MSKLHDLGAGISSRWQKFSTAHPVGRVTDQYKEVIVVFLATLLVVYVGMRLAVPTAKQPSAPEKQRCL